MADKSSSEILDEMFRELEEKSAKGELKDKSDFSTVLGSTLVTEDRLERGVKRKGKHKHSKHKSKKSKKHKSKSKHSCHKHSGEDDYKSTNSENNENCATTIENNLNHEKSNGLLEDGELEDDSNEEENSEKNDKKSHKKDSLSKSKSDHKREKSKHKSHSKSHPDNSESLRRRSSSTSRERTESHSKTKTSRIRSSVSSGGRHRSRSNERDKEEKIDKAKLLEIARKNALVMLSQGKMVKAVGSDKVQCEQIASIRAGGKSVEELTDFCKLLSDKEKEEIRHRNYLSDEERDSHNRGTEEDDKTTPFIHHPFKLKDPPAPIIMNIKSAVQLPTKTHAEKVADSAKLRLQFPVSSGTQHRNKEWVLVNPKEKEKKTKATLADEVITVPTDDTVFPDAQTQPQLDIGSIVSDRLKAIRALNDNPHDVQALGLMYRSQQQMQNWAESKQLPGQFTGSTGVQILSPQELAGPSSMQAWVRKDQFQRATPVQSRFGLFMLQKMGWKPGEGLGKNKEGTCEPLNIEIKLDKKGLVSDGEMPRKTLVTTTCKDLSSKHPVSALVELCNKRKWLPPEFNLVHDSGPDHRKNFLFKVHVNGVDYQPTVASLNKKHARAQAATVCLQSMGLLPREIEMPA